MNYSLNICSSSSVSPFKHPLKTRIYLVAFPTEKKNAHPWQALFYFCLFVFFDLISLFLRQIGNECAEIVSSLEKLYIKNLLLLHHYYIIIVVVAD